MNIRVNGNVFNWELDSNGDKVFPDADTVLRISSDDCPLCVVLAVDERHDVNYGTYTWVGPVYIQHPGLPCENGEDYVGKYYLFPAFKSDRCSAVHSELVRSVVASLLAPSRLRRCDARGIPWDRRHVWDRKLTLVDGVPPELHGRYRIVDRGDKQRRRQAAVQLSAAKTKAPLFRSAFFHWSNWSVLSRIGLAFVILMAIVSITSGGMVPISVVTAVAAFCLGMLTQDTFLAVQRARNWRFVIPFIDWVRVKKALTE